MVCRCAPSLASVAFASNGPPAAVVSIAAIASWIDPGRLLGAFSSIHRMASATGSVMVGLTSRGDGGGVLTWWVSTPRGVPARKGNLPVSISKVITPKA